MTRMGLGTPDLKQPAERRSAWAVANVIVWSICLGVTVLSLERVGVLGLLFALFCAHRLAGSVALLNVHEIPFENPSRRQAIAGWFYFTNTLALGLALALGGVALIIAQPNRAGIAFGLLALWLGSLFLILGVQLVRRWRDRLEHSGTPVATTPARRNDLM